MCNKATFALAAALALAGAAAPALAQTHHHHRHAERIYNTARQLDNTTTNTGAVLSPTYEPMTTGGGSLGYNQHNEIKN